MKKNPKIVQICEKYDNEKQKEELISALKKICGGNQNDFESSDEDTKKTNTNTAEGVNF